MGDAKVMNINLLVEKAKGLSILYVEDEKILLENTAYLLNKIFTNVDVAIDGKEAWEKYINNKYDIVITDILMPNMNGIELISNIREHNQNQEIIITSAYTEQEYKDQATKYNVTCYIKKPINVDNMIATLSESIDKLNLLHEKKNNE